MTVAAAEDAGISFRFVGRVPKSECEAAGISSRKREQARSYCLMPSMTDLIRNVDSPEEISAAAAELRQVVGATEIAPNASHGRLRGLGGCLGRTRDG